MTEQTPSLRETRERDLVSATRTLFDQRGFRDAPITEIAAAVGIARGLIYRQFSSKEELFVLTVTDYLAELVELLETAVAADGNATAKLERVAHAFAGFCSRYPAFVDSALAIMRQPARDLYAIVSESVWRRLGDGMAACIGTVAEVLHLGVESGEFTLADPDLTANLLWTQTLGAMHLARTGVAMRRNGSGEPELFGVGDEELIDSCVAAALRVAGR